MNVKRRGWIGFVGAVCLALVTAACGSAAGSGSSSAAHFVNGGTFTTSITTDPGNLDPQQSVLSATGFVDNFLYDSLIFETKQGKIEPELATKWKVTPTSVTFTLRKGITCSDGSSFGVQDVVQNFDYVKDPANASPLLGVYVPPGITAAANPSTNTVTVTAAQPDGFLLQGLGGGVPMVCAAGIADRKKLAEGSEGTGPFVLTQAVVGDHYTMKKRAGYDWGPNGATSKVAGFPSQVVVKIIQNQTTAANLLLSGGLNASGVTGPDEQRLDSGHLFKVSSTEAAFELFFNEAAGHPGSDERVRRALTMDLNLGQVAKVATGGLGGPGTALSVLSPVACPGNTVAGNLPSFNAAAAGKLLDQAGWTKGAGGIRSKGGQQLAFSFLEPTSAGDQVAAAIELISQNWKKLGVSVTIKPVTDVDLNGIIFGTGDWDAADITVNDGLPSAFQGFLSGPVPPKGTNFAHVDDATYNQDSAKAVGTPGAAGCALWLKGEKALYKAADVIPVANLDTPVYGQKVQFAWGPYGFAPTSVRLLSQ